MKLVAPEKLSGWRKALKMIRVLAGDPSDGIITMI
jgi:hypothetical protein